MDQLIDDWNKDLWDSWDHARWESFKKKFKVISDDNSYFLLAQYASFPVLLSSDLLYKIYLNFILPSQQVNQEGEAPLWQVSEFLFSPIVKEIGNDLYEIHPTVKKPLKGKLKMLVKVTNLPENKRLALFMREYLEKCRSKLYTETLAKAEEFNYKLELDPREAVRQVLEIIQKAKPGTLLNNTKYLLQWGRNYLDEIKGEQPSNLREVYNTLELLIDGLHSNNASKINEALEKEYLKVEDSNTKGYSFPLDKSLYSQLNLHEQQNLEPQPLMLCYFIPTPILSSEIDLSEEIENIEAIKKEKNRIPVEIMIRKNATIQDLRNDVIQFRERISLIHFAGHADRMGLLFHADILSLNELNNIIKTISDPILIVLNTDGFFDKNEVNGFKNASFILTEYFIENNKATKFSEIFYKELFINRESISNAYSAACTVLETFKSS